MSNKFSILLRKFKFNQHNCWPVHNYVSNDPCVWCFEYTYTFRDFEYMQYLYKRLYLFFVCLFFFSLDVFSFISYIISVNAYICYKNMFIIQKKVSHLTFQQQIVAGLIGNYRAGQGRTGRRSLNCRVRLSGRHFIDWIPDKRRLKCAVCIGKSGNFAGSWVRTWCPDCGVGLCVGQCFRNFHTLVMYEEWWQ